jgi:hypothetical protein
MGPDETLALDSKVAALQPKSQLDRRPVTSYDLAHYRHGRERSIAGHRFPKEVRIGETARSDKDRGDPRSQAPI